MTRWVLALALVPLMGCSDLSLQTVPDTVPLVSGENPPPRVLDPRPQDPPEPEDPTPTGGSEDSSECPEGYEVLDREYCTLDSGCDEANVKAFGYERVQIPKGVTKKFCLVADAPLVPKENRIWKIEFTHWLNANSNCGQTQPAQLTHVSGVPWKLGGHCCRTALQASGAGASYGAPSVYYPDVLKRGVYLMTIRGDTPYKPDQPLCTEYRLHWSVSHGPIPTGPDVEVRFGIPPDNASYGPNPFLGLD